VHISQADLQIQYYTCYTIKTQQSCLVDISKLLTLLLLSC